MTLKNSGFELKLQGVSEGKITHCLKRQVLFRIRLRYDRGVGFVGHELHIIMINRLKVIMEKVDTMQLRWAI